jgi:outer membrane protein assembly factor BamB
LTREYYVLCFFMRVVVLSSGMPKHSRALETAMATAFVLLALSCSGEDERSTFGAHCGATDAGVAGLAAPELVWSHATPDITYYSPRGTDLDGDGKLEIVVAGGREIPAKGSVLALDGVTGAVLWEIAAREELYSSPVFLDVTRDGVKDVFAGGRNKEFLAVDGASGELLWLFPHDGVSAQDPWFNFYTPAVIPDQTGDGIEDLLLATGGADYIEPFAPRPSGQLVIVDAARGTVVAYAETPDEAETYMSPLILPGSAPASPVVLFGTGGETRAGGLWKVNLSDVGAGSLAAAEPLVRGSMKGAIAPPAFADLDKNGGIDVIVATFDGRLIAFEGATPRIRWQHAFENSESYSTPTLGYFDEDEIPDVFAVFLRGAFPEYESATRVVVSGRDGTILWQGSAGNFSMSGDVAIDLNGDRIDEVLFTSNDTTAPATLRHRLHWFDPTQAEAHTWGEPLGAFSPSSPWVGDVDGNGCLDLIVAHRVPGEGMSVNARVSRFRVAAGAASNISWSGYLGTRFDSTLPAR